MAQNASPLLALLRRLEAQNIWRMTYNVLPMQQNSSTAQQEASSGARPWGRERWERCAGGR